MVIPGHPSHSYSHGHFRFCLPVSLKKENPKKVTDARNPTNRGISRWVRSLVRGGSRGLVGGGPGPTASAIFQAARCSQLRGEGRRSPGLARLGERGHGFGSHPGNAGQGRRGRQGPAASWAGRAPNVLTAGDGSTL